MTAVVNSERGGLFQQPLRRGGVEPDRGGRDCRSPVSFRLFDLWFFVGVSVFPEEGETERAARVVP